MRLLRLLSVSSLVVCIFVSQLCLVMPAQADVVAMLSVKRDPKLAERDVWAVQHAITDFFAERDIPLVLPEQARQRLGDRYEDCATPHCASAYTERLSADYAVGAALFGDGARSQSVNVAVIESDGTVYNGGQEIGDGGVNGAAEQALALAWERFQRGPGPWLDVRGPEHHKVFLDGKPVGILPYREKVQPGVHQLRVQNSAGITTYETTVRVPDDRSHYTMVDASVTNVAPPASAASAASTASAEQAEQADGGGATQVSYWNYIAGGALVVGGGYMAGLGIRAKVHEGKCTDPPSCEYTHKFGAPAIATLAVGSVLVAAGVAWLAWRPLRTTPSVQVDARGARLSLRGSF